MNASMTVPKFSVVGLFRWLASLFFIIAGANHFVMPEFYIAMMPSFMPLKEFFVVVTGIAEIVLGIAIQFPAIRRRAGMLLIALLVAIFPANIYVAFVQPPLPNLDYTPESMWWRLLLQPLFIAWIWWVAVTPASPRDTAK